MRQRLLSICLLPLAILAALPALTSAQEITGTILGKATDQSGAVLPGVIVVARHQGTGLSRETTTADDGGFTLSYLPIGTYDVTFTLSGFKTFSAKAIELHVNDRIQIDGSLSVGQLSEVVEVIGSSPLIQATSAVQNLMGPTQVQELPLNNRNFVQLATLVPGVNSSLPDEVGIGLASTVSLSIAGNRRNSVNWLVDGASNVDTGSNITLLSTPTLDSIEEFKIITSGYSAEWPRSGGGIINVVTKSGTTCFAGAATSTTGTSS
jgi:Carboxypeptidase regulatory-like domain